MPDRWGRCELDASLAQSLLAGTRHGIAVRSPAGEDNRFYFLSREWKGFPAEVGNSMYSGYLVVEGVYSDSAAPARVNDLKAVPAGDEPTGSATLLEWTAAGDDGLEGTAARVLLRCDRYPIGPHSWESAAPLPDARIPLAPGGERCSILLNKIPEYRPLFLALRYVDEVGNLSVVSNACRIGAPSGSLPDCIKDLAAKAGPGHGDVTLTWETAECATGRAARVLMSEEPIQSLTELLDNCTSLGAVPLDARSWTAQGLAPGTRYFFTLQPDSGPHEIESGIQCVSASALEDKIPPAPVDALAAGPGKNSGEILLSWQAAGDDGTTGRAALYRIYHSSGPFDPESPDEEAGVSYIEIKPPPEGDSSTMRRLFGGLDPQDKSFFTVTALDEAGNSSCSGLVSARPASCALSIWACEDLARVHPVTGDIFELDPEGYGKGQGHEHRLENRVWDGASGTVSLRCAKGETVAFQLCLEAGPGAPVEGVRVEVHDLKGPSTIKASQSIKVFREWYVPVGDNWFPVGLVPVEMLKQPDFSIPDTWCEVPGQRNQALWIDCLVPGDAPAGVYLSRLTVRASGVPEREITLRLEVSPFRLPDRLSYCMHFMDYNTLPRYWGLRGDDSRLRDTVERNFMRMAHANRVNLGILPYGSNPKSRNNTILEGAPILEGAGENIRVKDWSAYDSRWGPYLDGSAFQELPRASVPVAFAYLPYHLSWPTPIMDREKDKTAYEKAYFNICREFESHIENKGW
ncbi:MAG: hypothetical protein U9N45_06260, partial [Gemmatimonadota bacterium]|nr:hypothetical protein [Gemmatimonadota bacterium]